MFLFKQYKNIYKLTRHCCILYQKQWLHNSTNKYSYIHKIGQQPLLYQTVGELVKNAAEKYHNREAIIFCQPERRKLTFQEVHEKTNEIAVSLLSIGLKKGDKIALWGPNTVEWYLLYFAAAKIGVITAMINPLYTLPELKYSLEKTQVSTIFSPELFKSLNYYEILNQLVKDGSKLQNIIVSGSGKLPGSITWRDFTNLGKTYQSTSLRMETQNVLPDDPFTIQFTSGTTGKSKACVNSHFNFINNSYQIALFGESFKNYQRFCLQTPFFHVFATGGFLLPGLLSGSTVVIPSEGYNPIQTLSTVENEKCTYINGTPTMYVDLCQVQKREKFDLSTLEFGLIGAAPCNNQQIENITTILGIKTMKAAYGMSELSGAIFFSRPGEKRTYVSDTVGCVVDHIEVKVIDINGSLVPFGTPGELLARGFMTMSEYFNDEDKTQETKSIDGWLRTGDRFILYENGYGQIVGRIKEMINRGGENIFPKEIEDVLDTHPDIIESQVFGVDDERLGEDVAVCLRLNQGSNLTIDQIRDYCTGKMAKYKIPRYMMTLEEFPKTTSGKIQKFKLKEMFEILSQK